MVWHVTRKLAGMNLTCQAVALGKGSNKIKLHLFRFTVTLTEDIPLWNGVWSPHRVEYVEEA